MNSENISPPVGIVAILEEYKLPICVGVCSLLAMFFYGKLSNNQ